VGPTATTALDKAKIDGNTISATPKSRKKGTRMEQQHHLQGRYRGSLLGLAVGDALGTTIEFVPQKAMESRPKMTDIVGGGPFDLQPGQWTDGIAPVTFHKSPRKKLTQFAFLVPRHISRSLLGREFD
jgi:hypothetical protein